MSSLAKARLGVLAILIAALAVVAVAGGRTWIGDQIEGLTEPSLGNITIFVVLYALATVLLVPGTASTVLAGILFGPMLGTVAAVAGATLGATGSYTIARGLGRSPVASLESGKLANLDQWISERQFLSMLVLRLLPILPFTGLNYAAGLSSVRPLAYITATLIGIAPASFVIASVGDAANDPLSWQFLVALSAFALLVASSGFFARRWVRARDPQG